MYGATLNNHATKVALALGSNLTPRREFLEQGLRLLNQNVFEERPEISYTYENKALLPEGAPLDWNCNYLNLVVCGYTRVEPLQLLHLIKQIERDLGRRNSPRWSPREIDIDILCYGNLEINTPELTIPHQHLSKRPFVVVPLADVWPALELKGLGLTVGQLARRMRSDDALLSNGPLDTFT